MAEVPHRALRVQGDIAAGFVFLFSAESALGLYLSAQSHPAVWFTGQLVLGLAMVQWFALQHEAGHNTLFRSRAWNNVFGHVASLFTVIPFHPWRSIHALHHRWTGWQDVDPTTENLVPRELATFERVIINFCWKFWIPLFSILYRTHNYWNLPRLWRRLPRAHHRKKHAGNILGLAAVYGALILWLGPALFGRLFGVAFLLSLIVYDPILFSQHNHIPQKRACGADVSPHPPSEQAVFTRSLVFPPLISKYVLMHFDAHELHHLYPHVPGYLLDRIDEETPNAKHWLDWIMMARRTPASVIMFQSREDTGLDL